jgi:hypothetical protein
MQLVDQLQPNLSTTIRRLLSSSGSTCSSGSYAADHDRAKQQLQDEKDLHLQFCQDFGMACRQQHVRGTHTQEVRGKGPLLLSFRPPTCVVREADKEPTPALQPSATGVAAHGALADGVAAASAAAVEDGDHDAAMDSGAIAEAAAPFVAEAPAAQPYAKPGRSRICFATAVVAAAATTDTVAAAGAPALAHAGTLRRNSRQRQGVSANAATAATARFTSDANLTRSSEFKGSSKQNRVPCSKQQQQQQR